MEWEGQFSVPGRPEDVILRFADVERMARCVPGASLEGRDSDGNYLGSITVAFGPKRIVFRGKATAENDPSTLQGALTGQGAADMRSARFKVRVTYTLRSAPEAPATQPQTIVMLRSDADLQGVIADFARTGGNAVAKIFMEEFSRRVAEDFAAETEPGDKKMAAVDPTTRAAQNAPLSGAHLFNAAIHEALKDIWLRIRRLWSPR
jgi:carbon monoxide dehydrogenase subunit G